MLASLLLAILTVLTSLFCVGLVAVSKNIQINIRAYFALSMLLLNGWVVLLYLSNLNTPWALYFNRLVYASPILGLFFLGQFFNVYYNKVTARHFTWLGVLGLAIAATGSSVAVTKLNVLNITPRLASGRFMGYNIIPGKLNILVAAILVLLSGLLLARLLIAYREADEHTKKPLRIVLITLSLAIAVSLTADVISPLLGRGSDLANLASSITGVVFIISAAYSILRYSFLDVRFFALRALAYLISLLAVTFIVVLPVIIVFNHFLGITLDRMQLFGTVFFSGLVLAFLQYIRQFFDRITSKVFFRKYYDPQDVLDRLSNVLVHTADVRRIREDTAKIIADALKPESLKYVLFSDQAKEDARAARAIDAHGKAYALNILDIDELNVSHNRGVGSVVKPHIALAVKLRTTHEDLGYMIIGYKQSGEAYTERDKRLLSVAADEIAISLQNALRFEEIQNFNIKLQREVDEKTRELRRKNQKLIELDETKDDFISMASHQLRTPLTSVKGYLSMVLEGDAGKLNETQTKMLGQAFTSSQRMVFLITDLLNVSRLKTGKFVIDAAPVDLSTMIQSEIAQLTEAAQAKNLQLTYQKPAAFPKLMLDETKTRQVLMNFIDNAIYYTPEGGHIRIELADKPATVELRVIDDGIGVPKGEQHHLFTKFYRAANARKARPDGTGLGLFMAKKVVIAQGGSIIFESQENKGSTFGFIFSKSKLKVPAVIEPKKPILDSTATAR